MRTPWLLTLLLAVGCVGAGPKAAPPPMPGAFDPVPASPVRPAPAPKPCAEAVRACVDLSAGEAWLQSNGKVVYGPVPVAIGPPGHATPRGTFDVLWKDAVHRSST